MIYIYTYTAIIMLEGQNSYTIQHFSQQLIMGQ